MNASFTEPVILTHVKMIEHLAKRIGNAHLNTIGLTQSQADIIVFLHASPIKRFINGILNVR